MVRTIEMVLAEFEIKRGDQPSDRCSSYFAQVFETACELKKELNETKWAPELGEAITQRRKQARWPSFLSTPKRILAAVFSEKRDDLLNEVAALQAIVLHQSEELCDQHDQLLFLVPGQRELIRTGIITTEQFALAAETGKQKAIQFFKADTKGKLRLHQEWADEKERNQAAA